jgi:penicillin V acylase-like amidase (Ntn superfamily)
MKKFLYPAILLCLCLWGNPVWACTGVVATGEGRVLVGNNEDWVNPRTKVWFVSPANGRYGSMVFGFDNYWYQGGMNQKGLFFDGFGLKPKEVTGQQGKPRFKGNLLKEIMATCATVEEALALLAKYNLHFMDRFQLFLADAHGDAAIVEADAVIPKKGRYQVVTNFRQSSTKPEDISCPRFGIASSMLEKCSKVSVPRMRRILAATHQEGITPTLYSNIYDLKAKRVYVYNFHNFQDEVVIDLEAELKKKPKAMDLPSLFKPNYAAQVYFERFTKLKKKYRHSSPDFEVGYPSIYKTGEPSDPSQVFLTQNSSPYNRTPVLTVSVTSKVEGMPLSQAGSTEYAKVLKRFGDRVKVLCNRPVELSGDIEAYETRIAWRWKGKIELKSLVLSVFREGKLISVALHNDGDIDYLKHIPYSLRFK